METGKSSLLTTPVALLGDRVLLVAIGMSALASAILGFQFVDSGLAMGATLALVVAAGLVYASAAATLTSRWVLTFVLVSLVALHIQLSRGMIEFHFGVFVTLALLLVYQDWRTIVFGAVLLGGPLSGGGQQHPSCHRHHGRGQRGQQ